MSHRRVCACVEHLRILRYRCCSLVHVSGNEGSPSTLSWWVDSVVPGSVLPVAAPATLTTDTLGRFSLQVPQGRANVGQLRFGGCRPVPAPCPTLCPPLCFILACRGAVRGTLPHTHATYPLLWCRCAEYTLTAEPSSALAGVSQTPISLPSPNDAVVALSLPGLAAGAMYNITVWAVSQGPWVTGGCDCPPPLSAEASGVVLL
jgi:hypothetical protein